MYFINSLFSLLSFRLRSLLCNILSLRSKCTQCLSGVTLLVLLLASCSGKEKADLIIHNAVVYTVDSAFSNAEAFAVKDGKFLAVGSSTDILEKYQSKEIIDAEGKAVYPGFIDSHCHFYAYGLGLQELDLVGTRSFEEVIRKVIDYSKTNPNEWIIGRGWDQNDWEVKEFPDRYTLDSLFPNTPVFLKRIDGHASLANAAAFKAAKISQGSTVSGGVIEMEVEPKGKYKAPGFWTNPNADLHLSVEPQIHLVPTGILVDNAVTLVEKVVPKPSAKGIQNALLAAQKNCLQAGLTTVDDAGLEKNIVETIERLHKSGELKIRVYAMLSDNQENFDHYLDKGPFKTERMNVRSFKFYGDGALGSRGACLLEHYSDKPAERGFLLSTPAYFDSMAKIMADKGFQMNTHCIGDSTDRLLLGIYASYVDDPHSASTKGSLQKPGDRRWRIEHLQVTTPNELALLQKFRKNIIPSVQPTHATSDMYWAKERLGSERVKYAYAYNDMLKSSDLLALGTDFPVENINPMYTFYAAVARQDLKGYPEGGFQPENALTRENTLRGMTIWGAYANFEENEKGSIEAGKLADFVILENDIMKCSIDLVPKTTVLKTYIHGECLYKK